MAFSFPPFCPRTIPLPSAPFPPPPLHLVNFKFANWELQPREYSPPPPHLSQPTTRIQWISSKTNLAVKGGLQSRPARRVVVRAVGPHFKGAAMSAAEQPACQTASWALTWRQPCLRKQTSINLFLLKTLSSVTDSESFGSILDSTFNFDMDLSVHFDSDLNLTFHFDSDIDPTFYFDPDPPFLVLILIRIRIPLFIFEFWPRSPFSFWFGFNFSVWSGSESHFSF